MPPSEFVAALEQDYPVEALTELGLYERVDDELRLPSWLDGDAHLYVTIDEDNRTIAFSRGNEFLFPMTRTALDYALERIPPDSTQATGHSIRRRVAGCCRSHAAARAAGRQ